MRRASQALSHRFPSQNSQYFCLQVQATCGSAASRSLSIRSTSSLISRTGTSAKAENDRDARGALAPATAPARPPRH
jgi:hypothetical protein